MNIVKDISMFLFIFSIYNDNLTVDFVGGTVFKIMQLQFLIIHAKDIYIAFSMHKNRVVKSFLIFFAILFTIISLTEVIYFNNILLKSIPLFLTIVAIYIYFSYYDNLEKVLYMIWAVMIISAIYSLFAPTVNPWTFRRSGGTVDPNEYSMQLLTVIFFTIYLYIKNKNIIFLLGSLGLFFYSLLFAGSKSSILVLGIVSLYAIIVKFDFVVKKILSLKGLIGIIIVIAILFSYNFSSIKAVSGMEERAHSTGTMHQRFMAWKAGSEMIRDNFLLGTGFDSFAKSSVNYLDKYLSQYDGLAAHNIFVKLFAETGVFPFIAFIVALIYLFTTNFTQILRSDYFWLSLAAYATILMGMTLSLIYNKFFWFPLAFLTYATMITSMTQDQKDKEIDGKIS